MAIRNIIFDLGGIFIDIHYHRTKDAFTALGVPDFDAYFQQTYSNPLFALLEKGEMAPAAFYEAFRNETGLPVTDAQIAQAWNAMLGDFRPQSVALLPTLKSGYNLYLLSNTNQIHHEAFTRQFEQEFNGQAFDALFDTAYYSHLLGERKPAVQCYQKVMQLHQMVPEDTLFIDDTYKNIEGAQQAGLHTLWLQENQQLEQALPKLLGR